MGSILLIAIINHDFVTRLLGAYMKNFRNYDSHKYICHDGYTHCGEGIYEKDGRFFTSLSFEQEPEKGEGISPQQISQYPLEDILEHYLVYISDFYSDLNNMSKDRCYLEFASTEMRDILNLRTLIGKCAFNCNAVVDGEHCVKLVIE